MNITWCTARATWSLEVTAMTWNFKMKMKDCSTSTTLMKQGFEQVLHKLWLDSDVTGQGEGTHEGGNHEPESKVQEGVFVCNHRLTDGA